MTMWPRFPPGTSSPSRPRRRAQTNGKLVRAYRQVNTQGGVVQAIFPV